MRLISQLETNFTNLTDTKLILHVGFGQNIGRQSVQELFFG